MSKKTIPNRTSGKETKEPIRFAILRIELKKPSINESYISKESDNIQFTLGLDLTANKTESTLTITVRSQFELDDHTRILSFNVENEYRIPNIQNYIIDKKFTEKGFLEFIADLSLSHARGLQSTLINNHAQLNGLYVPVANLGAVRNDNIEYES